MLSSALDFFAPEVLCQLYPEWRFEGLDGLSLVRATKIASRSAELAGMCCLIHDQTWTPFFAHRLGLHRDARGGDDRATRRQVLSKRHGQTRASTRTLTLAH